MIKGMSSLSRMRSIKLNALKPSKKVDSRKHSTIRRHLADHGRNLQKFSLSMVHARQTRRKMGRVQMLFHHLKRIYHRRGLKHLLLVFVLVIYQFLGAALFLYLEKGAEDDKEKDWRRNVTHNRTIMIDKIVPALINNTNYFLYLNKIDSDRMAKYLNRTIEDYETALGIKYSDQKIKWDFWNAMLYAGTVCTTIGYGHLYPNTYLGQWATMIYAIFGIPLVLSILEDMGKLLTRGLKYPWMIVKMACRRLSQHCTNMSTEEIRRLDNEDRRSLEVFDLPIPVALGVVIGWIFFSSATICVFEDWDYFKAFYFFFISLTTIGLGDIVPRQPKYLLFMFGFIIVGLSLVSMCVSLIQATIEKSYNSGHEDVVDQLSRRGSMRDDHHNKVTLGVIQRLSSYSLSSKSGSPGKTIHVKKVNRMCQTLLSIPSPSRHPHANVSLLNHSSGRLISTSISFDDVMKLVDTEEGDIIVMSELSKEGADGSLVKGINEDSEEDFGMATYETVLLPPLQKPTSFFGYSQVEPSVEPFHEDRSRASSTVIPRRDIVSEPSNFLQRSTTISFEPSENIVQCGSPHEFIPTQPHHTVSVQDASCSTDIIPIASSGYSLTRRFTHLFTSSPKPTQAPVVASESRERRWSLFSAFRKKSPNRPIMMEPFEQSEYKEIELEQDDGDKTPLDPVKQKRSFFFSA